MKSASHGPWYEKPLNPTSMHVFVGCIGHLWRQLFSPKTSHVLMFFTELLQLHTHEHGNRFSCFSILLWCLPMQLGSLVSLRTACGSNYQNISILSSPVLDDWVVCQDRSFRTPHSFPYACSLLTSMGVNLTLLKGKNKQSSQDNYYCATGTTDAFNKGFGCMHTAISGEV